MWKWYKSHFQPGLWFWNLREGLLRALLNTAAEPRLSPYLAFVSVRTSSPSSRGTARASTSWPAGTCPSPCCPWARARRTLQQCRVSRVTCRVWARVTCGRGRVVRRVQRVRHELLQRGLGVDEAHLPVWPLTCTQETIITSTLVKPLPTACPLHSPICNNV